MTNLCGGNRSNREKGKNMSIGVLLFATAGDRLKGDPGYPGTFEFPVEYGFVEGSYRDLIEGSPDVCRRLCEAAKKLAQKNVSAIAGDCGLMALYQRQIADAAGIPVISSSLLFLPFARMMISPEQSVGILTGHAALLGEHHLRAAGVWDLEGIVIHGMQNEPHFKEVVIEGTAKQEYGRMKEDVRNGVRCLRRSCKSLGAVLLECSNLAVFGAEIAKEFCVPVFDINSGVYMMQEVLDKRYYVT